MNCQTLVHELGREQPNTTKELLDITTRLAFGEEAVRAVFLQSRGKEAPGGGPRTSTIANERGTKRSINID
jgi:hypothetical protein